MSHCPEVLLAFPCYGNPHPGAARSVWQTATRSRRVAVFEGHRASLLACGFNMAWCRALGLRGGGLAHFAMLHSDIEPEPWWLDLLLAEAQKHDLDILSAVAPIKDGRGLTSTGIAGPDPFTPLRRLTTAEVAALPATFTAADTAWPDRPLLVNTGCMVVRMRPDSHLAHFEVRDRIRETPGGWVAESCSEDWGLSLRAAELGWRVGATTAVRLAHYGEGEITNVGAWGTCATDPDAFRPD